FHCDADLPLPPPFPTRRSSDLRVSTDTLNFDEHRVPARNEERHVRERRGLRLEQGRQQVAFEVMHPEGGQLPRIGQRPAERGTGDRKSTRLNSSHVKNSYAVFC